MTKGTLLSAALISASMTVTAGLLLADEPMPAPPQTTISLKLTCPGQCDTVLSALALSRGLAWVDTNPLIVQIQQLRQVQQQAPSGADGGASGGGAK